MRGYNRTNRRGFDRNCDRNRDYAHEHNRDYKQQRGAHDPDHGSCASDRGALFHGASNGRREPHRPPKIPFPTFHGESDPLTWLNKCNNYFRIHRMLEDKVWMVSLHLDGTATEWYYQMECNFGMVYWLHFFEFVNLRFGPPIRTNSIGEIKALICTSTVEDYSWRYLALFSRCENLSMRKTIDLYIGGLGQPLASDVEL